MRFSRHWLVLAALCPISIAAQDLPVLAFETDSIETFDRARHEVQVAYLDVSESRSTPSDRTIRLKVMKLPKDDSAAGPPVFYLAGGPGGSAIGAARIPSTWALFERLRAHGDVILVDQRGTGSSVPRLGCMTQLPPVDALTSRARFVEVSRENLERCAARMREQGVDISAYNTAASADDLDDVRKALGADRMSLLGFSYGTHFGQAMVKRHGDRLHRVVLVGTEPLDATYKLPSTYDAQLKRISELAASDPNTSADVPDFEGTVHEVLAQLDEEPLTVRVPSTGGDSVDIPIGRDGLLYLMRRDIGDGNDIPIFPAWFEAMRHGDTEILQWFVTKRYQGARGVSVMSNAVDCASGIDADRESQIEREIPTSFMGAMTNMTMPEICESVGNPDLGPEFRAPLQSDVPVLFVSGAMDSNTPPYQAESVRSGLRNSTHIIVEYAGHEDMLPNREVQDAIVAFLSGHPESDRTISRPRPKFVPSVPTWDDNARRNARDHVGKYEIRLRVGDRTSGATMTIESRDGSVTGHVLTENGNTLPVLRVLAGHGRLFLRTMLGDTPIWIAMNFQGDEFTGVWWAGNRIGGTVEGARLPE